MQEKVKHCIKWLYLSETIIGIVAMAALVAMCSVWEQDVGWVRLVLGADIGMAIVAMLVVLILVGRRLCQYVWEFHAEAEASWEKEEEEMREVIGNIAHDLRTPLAAIRGYAQGILDGVANSPERMNRYVTTIRNKTDDMAKLATELILFTNIYQKNIQYEWQEVVAGDYLSECISELSLDLETKMISLAYRFDAGQDVAVRIDTEQMKRVIDNIIGNAVKYMQNEIGIVFVHVTESRGNVVVRIADNGVGIGKKDLTRIFERSYRTDSSRNSKTGGGGLGLAIAKKIMQDHGGGIWAESEIGEGTVISFSLPIVGIKQRAGSTQCGNFE